MSPFDNGPGIYLPPEAASCKLKCIRHIMPGTCQGLGKPQLLKSPHGSPVLVIFDEYGMIILFVKDIFFISVAILKFIIAEALKLFK